MVHTTTTTSSRVAAMESSGSSSSSSRQMSTSTSPLRVDTDSGYTCRAPLISSGRRRRSTGICCTSLAVNMLHRTYCTMLLSAILLLAASTTCKGAGPSAYLLQAQPPPTQPAHQTPVNNIINNNNQQASHPMAATSNPYIQTTHEILLDLRQQLLTRALEFDDHFKTLLVNSKRELHNFFRETYGFVYESNAGVFMSMFEGLEQYYANGSGKLTESLESFYVVLYQKIFQALNRGREFDASYMRCATERMIYLKPMGEAPEKQIQLLKHTLIAARSLYQALNQTIDIIKSIISIVPTTQCTNLINDKLLKYNHLTVIGSQSGLVTVRQPCMKFCEEVIGKCIGRYNLDDLNNNWKTFVALFLDLITKLTTNYNIQANVQHLDSQISDAVMNFQENGEQVSNEVFKACGSPKVPQETHHVPIRPFNRIRRATVVMSSNRLHSGSGIASATRHELPAASSRDYSGRLRSSASDQTGRGSPQQARAGHQQQQQQQPGYSKPAQLIKDLIASDKKLDSNMLLDRMKDYIVSSRFVWQRLGNSVCASNNATAPIDATVGERAPVVAGSTQPSCFQESFAISDLNTDIRYQKEMRQLIHRLSVMQWKLQEALAGREVDWNSPEATPVEPARPSRPGFSPILRPFDRLSPTSSPAPPQPSPASVVPVDEESSPDDVEESGEEGSGEGDLIDSTDPDEDYPDETTPAHEAGQGEPAASGEERPANPNNDLQPAAPTAIPPVLGNDIGSDSGEGPLTSNDLDAASAQKSGGAGSPHLVIPGAPLLVASACLLLVTRFL